MIKILCMLSIIFMLGCGFTKDTSKGLGDEIGSSFKKADEKEELLDTREKVRRSKAEYNDCLDNNPSRESSCESLKNEYEQNVEEYVELQKKLNEL